MLHYLSASDDRRKSGVQCRMPREHFVIHVASSELFAADILLFGLARLDCETTCHAIVLHHCPSNGIIGVQDAHIVIRLPHRVFIAAFGPDTTAIPRCFHGQVRSFVYLAFVPIG